MAGLLGTLGGVVLLAVAIELGLALLGAGEPPRGRESGLVYQHVFLPILEPAQREGRTVLVTNDPRLVRDEVPLEKPAGTLRVCVFGGSATFGLGYSPNSAFPALLERILERALPGQTVEVLNLGLVALPSAGVAALVEDVLAHADPDLLVVYSGNNEFLELHSQRYFEARASALARLRRAASRTRLVRLARSLRGPGTRPVITSREIASQDARVDHREMLSHVTISDQDRRQVVEAYAENLRAMTDAARAADVPLVLMTVASNWRWWAMQDLEPDADSEAPSGPDERERLYRTALAAEAAGDLEAARAAYRASFNADPHLRRATDELAEALREVAQERQQVELFDTIAYLEQRVPHGIVGFETFYDYVHFTPQGAFEVARGLAERLAELGLLASLPAAFVEQLELQWRALASAPSEGLAVGDWIGFGDDPARLVDRDLWKYDRLRDELDQRIASDPSDVQALAWRGNLRSFVHGEAESARADYEAALALGEDPVLRANLER